MRWRPSSPQFVTTSVDMAKKKTKRQPALSRADARKSIADDIQAYLASGKKIQQIPTGASGWQAKGGTRHIVLGKSKRG